MVFIRSTVPLAVAYAFLFVAGIMFLNYPSLQLTREDTYGSLVALWGVFYLLGGFVSVASTALRAKFTNNVSLWYFEISGLALSITANLVYTYALFKVGLTYNEFNVVAVSMVVAAFASSLVGRSLEALQYVKILKTADRSTIPTMRG